MKNFWFTLCFLLALTGCNRNNNAINEFVDSAEYESNPNIISNSRVGKIKRGSRLTDLDTLFKESRIRIKKNHSGFFNEEYDEYNIYAPDKQLLLTVSPKIPLDTNSYINRIVVRDTLYKTAKGIGVNSSLGDIRREYLAITYSQTSGDLLVSVRDMDFSFLFNKNQIPADAINKEEEDLNFKNLPDSIRVDAIIVFWKTDTPTQQLPYFLTPAFWHENLNKAAIWGIRELPSILFLVLFFILALRFLKFAVKKMKQLAMNKVKQGTDHTGEVRKRINTLSSIIYSVIKIILWVIFLLILLSKFNINIAPLLASAGILGLAIGFGAQELVRDFISGFFILLEDQLRTGDTAVINGTEGVVEKIELRTITLRDSSGTVHIFQNGKINSLSNKTKEWSALVLDIGVAYKEDTDHVSRVMQAVGEQMQQDPQLSEAMISPITISGVNDFGSSAVIIRAILKTKPGAQWSTGREYRRRLKKAFEAENIEIPFNYNTITWGDTSNPIRIAIEGQESTPTPASSTSPSDISTPKS